MSGIPLCRRQAAGFSLTGSLRLRRIHHIRHISYLSADGSHHSEQDQTDSQSRHRGSEIFSVVGQIPFRQETFGSEDSAGERSLS